MRPYIAIATSLAALLLVDSAGGEEIRLERVVITVMEELEIPARSEGALSSLLVREGDLVTPDQQIGGVRDNDARLELQRHTINLQNAKALAANTVRLRIAKKEQERAASELARALRWLDSTKDVVSTSELERLQLAVDKAELEIEQAEEDLATAKRTVAAHENEVALAEDALSLRRIVSPVRGMVVEVAKRRGSWVKPGDAVARVIRLDRLRVEAILPPDALLKPLKGSRCQIKIDLPERGSTEHAGRVVFVRPEINPINKQIRIWAEIDNPDLVLRPGLSGAMVIHVGETAKPKKKDAATPPSEASTDKP